MKTTENTVKLSCVNFEDGGEDTVRKELLTSEICQCFDMPQVRYREYSYQGQLVTESDIISSKEYSMVSKMAFDIYACNHGLDTLEVCKELDPITYYGMHKFGAMKKEVEMFERRLYELKKTLDGWEA